MQFAVIGLGVFGRACAFELQSQGNEVLGIDMDENEVNKVSDILSHSVIADATDIDTLKELNLSQFDGVIVSIGEDLEASLLCTLNLIKLPVQNLWVKAKTDAHHDILDSLGVTNIIHPEQDMGIRIAQAMAYPMMKQYLSLGNDEFLVRIDVPEQLRPITVGKIKSRHPDTSLLLIIRDNHVERNFDSDTVIQYPDRLVYTGLVSDLKYLSKSFIQS
ncbi:TrkA family potassium uptake protein [Psychrobacter sp. YP14]|uniref:TrkA family potassium uptake protein n=3 Tax=Psychrobacter TaxID=497 RepID=A0A844M0M5_9GAMM|nr:MULTISPECIES: TrkA family potassium uptake protein [Psychrobacter]AWT48728.1 TrkA family potassium uptake protein [Psychrobacter sp. YP14]MUG32057.1 TrkA family potassium uptake protein [Psychrobacter sanguinis]UNK06075.1 TrkA family potassium uptake protein [Psychrobacter sp. PraFG1]